MHTATLSAAMTATGLQFVAAKAAAADAGKPLRIGLIGCGGRGTGAMGDALHSSDNVVVTVLGDLDETPLNTAYQSLKAHWEGKGKFAVKNENKFSGYDAIQKVCSHPEVDLVIQATPPGLRYLTLRAAVENNKHSFVEKPVCVDAFTYAHVLASGEMARKKGLALTCGLQRRSENVHRAGMQKVHEGAIGEIVSAQAYWNGSIPWVTKPYGQKDGWTREDMDYQLRNWLSFVWLSGDFFVEQTVHMVDLVLWALEATPSEAYANGSHQEPIHAGIGDGFDQFGVDYTLKNKQGNPVQVALYGRQVNGPVDNKITCRIVGTKGHAVMGSDALIFEHGTHRPVWRYAGEKNNGYENEHTENIAGIRSGTVRNDIQFVADASFAAILGRESAYSGKRLEWQKLVDSNFRIGTGNIKPGKVDLPVKGVRVPGQYMVANYK